MKIKKIFQNIFKKTFQFLFKFLYGKIIINKNQQKINYKQKKISILNQKEKISSNNYLYEIKNGRIYTDLVEHVAIIQDNFIIPNISYQQIRGDFKNVDFNKTLITGTPRLKKKFKGSILSLVQGASGNNYFHFLFDIATKLKLCEQNLNLNQIDYFYLPGISSWQKKILSVFNIFEDRIINSLQHRHIQADTIFALEQPWYKKGFVQNEINEIPDWIIHFLREKFLSYKKKFQSNDKIFIDRSDSSYNHCKLINNKEIVKFLSDNGFSSYKISELDFFEQIYLFHNAKVVIGPHGAAFTNLIFSNPGLEIIEIIPDNHSSKKCQKFSEILNFNYKRIELSKINQHVDGDMFLEIDTIKKLI